MFDALDQAIYDTVHSHQGGAVRLAPKVGMNAGTLNNKANPANEDAQLNLRESIPIQLHLHDFRILATYAGLLDHAIVPLGDFRRTCDLELLDKYAAYHEELGQTAAAIRSALAAGLITREAVTKVRREMIEDAQLGFNFLARLEALVDER